MVTENEKADAIPESPSILISGAATTGVSWLLFDRSALCPFSDSLGTRGAFVLSARSFRLRNGSENNIKSHHEIAMPVDVQPETKSAWKIGAGTLLICSGTVYLAAFFFFDLFELIQDHPMEAPGSFPVGMMLIGLVLPVLFIGAAIFTFFTCISRCRTKETGIITAVSSLALMTGLIMLPFVLRELGFLSLFLPAVLLGHLMWGSSGWYLGSCIHLILGAWLLGWLDRFTRRRVTKTPP